MSTLLDAQHLFSFEEYPHTPLFEECQYPWEGLLRLEKYLQSLKLGTIASPIPEGVHLINPEWISIGEGTVVEPGVYIQGPCFIGKNCTLRYGAYLRGNVLAGDGCTIGHSTEIKHSILFNHVAAAHFNYVGDSILGNKCNLGAGVKCANLRLDHQAIHIIFQNEKINTYLEKLGVIAGDGAKVGCNCVLSPGTFLGRNSLCFPCLHIQGLVPENGIVKPGTRNIVE